MLSPTRPVFVLAATLLSVGAAHAQGVLFPPGSSIGLVPPKGMQLSKTFSGFEDSETGASMLTIDMPAASYPEVLKTFTPQGLAATGLEGASPATDWPVKGGDGKIIRGKQTSRGLVYRKWVVLAKSPTATVMLSVQAPELSASKLTDASIEQALKTVSLRPPPELNDQVAALPFRVGDLAGFRIVRTLSGSGLLLTEGPQNTAVGAAQPVIAIGVGLSGAVEPKNRAALAKQGFNNIAGVSDLVPDSDQSYTQNGTDWIRMDGRGTYRDTMEAIYVVQYLQFTRAGYIRTVAICRTLDKPPYEARFKALAESVTAK